MTAAETATLIKKLIKNTIANSRGSQYALTEQNDAARLDELRRVFSKLQSSSDLCLVNHQKKSSSSNAAAQKKNQVKEKWNHWLKKQHATFLSQLCIAVKDGRKSSLRTFMGVIASSPINSKIRKDSQSKMSLGQSDRKTLERINPNLIQKLVSALILPMNNEDGIVSEYMVEMLDVEFLSKYRDVQYYVLISIKSIAQQLYDKLKGLKKKNHDDDNDEDDTEDSIGIHAENLLRILLKIHLAMDQSELQPVNVKLEDKSCSNYLFLPPYLGASDDVDDEDNEDDDSIDEESDGENKTNDKKKKVKLSPVQAMRSHRAAMQDATLAILKLPLPARSLKLVLQHFPSHILPNATNPLLFADFCTRAYDMGGVTALLALNSLFVLMTQCGLEYKEFYPSLYNLIEPKIFYAKYRTRFFKLLVKCLSVNQMLPAYLIAAFCKKLCRCALNAPPSGALFVLALVSNLLRKHEECACLIHRTGDADNGGKLKDSFNIEEKDPLKSRAIETSLWELNALETHYHPAVSSMAKGCGMEDGNTLMHDLDEFLLHSYRSLFDQERKRASNKRKSKIPLTFHAPKSLFVQNDVFDGIFDFPSKKKKTNE